MNKQSRDRLSRIDGVWNSAAPLGLARSEITATECGGQIFAFGGVHKGYTVDVAERYDPADDRWSPVAPLPVPLDHAQAVSSDGFVYIVGGSLSATSEVSGDTLEAMMQTTNWDFAPRTALFRYDPKSDAYSRLSGLPCARMAHSAVVLGNAIYVVGGQGPNPGVMMRYDIAADHWSFLPGMPTYREHQAIGVVGGRIIVAGGRWPDPRDPDANFVFGNMNTATTEIFDAGSMQWASAAPMPTARGAGYGAVLQDRLYVVGGEILDSPERLTNAEVEAFDVATNRWMIAPDLPTPRHGLAAVALNGSLYAIGGGPLAAFSGTSVVEVFTPTA